MHYPNPRLTTGLGIALKRRPAHLIGSEKIMDLSVWIPLTVALGLIAMLAMFAFVRACDKV